MMSVLGLCNEGFEWYETVRYIGGTLAFFAQLLNHMLLKADKDLTFCDCWLLALIFMIYEKSRYLFLLYPIIMALLSQGGLTDDSGFFTEIPHWDYYYCYPSPIHEPFLSLHQPWIDLSLIGNEVENIGCLQGYRVRYNFIDSKKNPWSI